MTVHAAYPSPGSMTVAQLRAERDGWQEGESWRYAEWELDRWTAILHELIHRAEGGEQWAIA